MSEMEQSWNVFIKEISLDNLSATNKDHTLQLMKTAFFGGFSKGMKYSIEKIT
jgi:hypothetical protein